MKQQISMLPQLYMKRILFIILCSCSLNSLHAQVNQAFGLLPSTLYRPFNTNRYLPDSISKKKWTLNTFSGLSTSFISWKGGHATTFSVPVGLELNRRLNNNLYAFAAVSAAPTYINFRSSFMNADFNKTGFNTFSPSNKFNVFPKAEVGLRYVNDERTFEISGSMSVQRVPNYYYPVAPAIINSRN